MGAVHEANANAPVTPTEADPPLHHRPQSSPPHDPPPYIDPPLTPSSPEPSSPRHSVMNTGTPAFVPPPPPQSSTSTQVPSAQANSSDPLLASDARFADLILANVILPRLRVGILHYKDKESFEYMRQSKVDVSP